MEVRFAFAPKDSVVITLCDVQYRGRVLEVRMKAGEHTNLVQYVDDRGEFRTGEFYDDELSPPARTTAVGGS